MSSEAKFKNGDTVFYNNRSVKVRARVETMHRDGSVSITALFQVAPNGADLAGYLGFKYRTDASRLHATAAEAT